MKQALLTGYFIKDFLNKLDVSERDSNFIFGYRVKT